MLRRVPFTIVLVVVLLVLALATGPLRGPSRFVRQAVGIDLGGLGRHQWWSLFTANFFVDNIGQLIIVLIAAVIGVGGAERLMGSRRAMLAFLVTGVASSAISIGVQAIGVLAGEQWSKAVNGLVTIDPLSPILGTVAAASAFASVLWRRRIRFVVIASTVVFLLYSGQPSDLHRLLAALLGLLLGVLLTRQRIHLERWTSSHHETRILLAVAATLFALGPVITLVSWGRFGLLSPLGALVTRGISDPGTGSQCTVSGLSDACFAALGAQAVQGASVVVLALIPLLIMLASAYGLVKGRRVAVYLVAAIAAGDGILAGFYFGVVPAIGTASAAVARAGQSPQFGLWLVANAALPLIFAIIVVSQRRHFPIRASSSGVRRFYLTVGLGAAITGGLYLGLASLIAPQFGTGVTPFDLFANLPERFIPVSFLDAEQRDIVPATLDARLLYSGVGPVFWLVVLVAAVALLRGSRIGASNHSEPAQFRALAQTASGSMSFPGTWVGNSYWFDAERRMGLAYRVVNGCAVTTSEPVGTPRDRRDSLGQFLRFCDTNAWTPVFYGIHGEWADLLVEIGWSTTVIAEETVIDPTTWEMTGKKWQDVRSSVNRAAREGVRVIWSSWSELSPGVANQIAEISELWVVEKKLPELEFTLGGLDELRDHDVLLGIALDVEGHVQAVTSWLPTWSDGVLTGRTLDFMRRRADGMNGVMEFLIAEAAVRAQLDGLSFLSLSGAPLARAESDEKSGPLDRLLGMVGRSLEPVYGFRSLLNFKKKFQPRLESLHLAYPDALSLPAIAVAISRCYLPELSLRESAALVRSLR